MTLEKEHSIIDAVLSGEQMCGAGFSNTPSDRMSLFNPLTPTRMRRNRLRGNGTGDSAGIRILYMYVTSSGDIRFDNRSYAVVVQRKSCARQQISAQSVPSGVHVNDLSFKICVFQVVKGPHICRDCCYCSCWYVRML